MYVQSKDKIVDRLLKENRVKVTKNIEQKSKPNKQRSRKSQIPKCCTMTMVAFLRHIHHTVVILSTLFIKLTIITVKSFCRPMTSGQWSSSVCRDISTASLKLLNV